MSGSPVFAATLPHILKITCGKIEQQLDILLQQSKAPS